MTPQLSPIVEVYPTLYPTFVAASRRCSALNEDELSLEDGLYFAVSEKYGCYVIVAVDVDDGTVGVL